jgi:cation:H+ antiporter
MVGAAVAAAGWAVGTAAEGIVEASGLRAGLSAVCSWAPVVGDVFFRGGSLYHAAQADELFVTAAGLFMTAVVLAGMLVRQSRGWGRIGFEGLLLLGSYTAVVAVLTT